MSFEIACLTAATGVVGICPAPGRFGDYVTDRNAILDWAPDLVVTMTERSELEVIGASALPNALAEAGVSWLHLPIKDFGVPDAHVQSLWPEASEQMRNCLQNGGRVLVHCLGGCGRSGMVLLRLLADLGEDGQAALRRLRAVRACAVETQAQMDWALRL